jgi:phospholipid-binding lipoprotein MlaA
MSAVCTEKCGAIVPCLLGLALLIGGCASAGNPRDPIEPVNRAVYQFNDALDTALLKPLAQVYEAVLPQFVRTGVTNFFENIYDVRNALNDLLQGKIVNAATDVGRIGINTTIGIGGLFDVATEIGLEHHKEDFGQTLGWWGIPDGAYLQLPFFGPSTVRDTVGLYVDVKTDPVWYIWRDHIPTRNSLWGLYIVNTRANLLDSTKILQEAALDEYEFQRDAYLQRRRNLVYDGNPPPETERDEIPDVKVKPRSDADEPGRPAAPGASLNDPATDPAAVSNLPAQTQAASPLVPAAPAEAPTPGTL